MIAPSQNWSGEQTRWRNHYADTLTRQVARLTEQVRENRHQSHALIGHYESIVKVFQQGLSHPNPETKHKLVTLIRELHPLPFWWGKWSDWFRVIEQTIQLAAALGDAYHQAWFTVSLVEMLLTAGQATHAKLLLADAKSLSAQNSFAELSVRCAFLEYEVLKFLGEIPDRNRALDELERFIKEKTPLLNAHEREYPRLVFLLKKSDLLRRQSHLEEGLEYANQAFKIINRIMLTDPDLLGEATMRRSAAYWSLNDYPRAIADLETASELFGRVGNPISQRECLGDLGLIYWSAARYNVAESALQRSIQLSEQVKSLWSQAIRTGDLGLVYFSSGQLTLAQTLMARHAELARLTNNFPELNRADGNMGLLQVILGRFEAAVEKLSVNLDFSVQNDLPTSQGIVSANLAWAYDALGKHTKALDLAQMSLSISEEIKHPKLRMTALRSLGELQTDPDERARYTEEALAIARQLSRKLNEAACLLTLADCRKDESLYNEAVSLLRQIGAQRWLETKPVFKNLRLALLL